MTGQLGWFEFIILMGSLAAALTGVGKLLINIYNKTITKPQEKIASRLVHQSNEQLRKIMSSSNELHAKANEPLTLAIERLNQLLEESQDDRRRLHEADRLQDEAIKKNNGRLNKLELWREYTKGDK